MTVAVVNIVGSLGIGLAVVLVGHWGCRHAADLVPPTLPVVERASREKTLRRGARVCQVVGVLFAAAGIVVTLW